VSGRPPRLEWVLRLPPWVEHFAAAAFGDSHPTVEQRMAMVIELSRRNVEEGTGGPFAAAVFDRSTGRLVAPGVNLVVGAGSSIAHAEIVALVLAQQVVGRYELAAPGLAQHELVASTEPCAMCLGAIPWSGVRSLVCGARDEDARAIGFDEGAKRADWPQELRRRGIEVTREVCRAEARGVLER
jgi:tRNA(Arg) A34 adenosine deaminase TadA